jgi:2-polyprenyl-3-methyl-5-hydroxy-6-metoxy-1,4-benzoquinol methylase
MLDFLPDGIRSVLEVGCGNGNFLQQLAGREILRVGVEPDEMGYSEAKLKMDLCVHGKWDAQTVRSLSAEIGERRIDCVVFNDVLEHMESPWDARRLAHTFLGPQGHVGASIPNFLFYSNLANLVRTQDFKYETSGLLDIGHLRFFSRKSIVRMFEECGYSITRIEAVSWASSLKFRILNLLLLNTIADMRVMQWGIVARQVAR